MDPIVFAMPGSERQAAAIAACPAGRARPKVRRFLDGESYVRLLQPVAGCEAMVVCTLDRPDAKLVPLLWLAVAPREGGAVRVGLVAPYLAYMRQDKVFRTGEIVSARHFASLLGASFDWLVTVDPHLHRIGCLGEIFTRPAIAVHAAPAIASWIGQAMRAPLLVGPDEESQQWVDDIASRCGADSIVLAKQRFGDHEVSIDASGLPTHAGRTPVLVDDMVSTARTMLASARLLREHGYPAPVCVVVHALFAEAAYADLQAVAADIVTCDTVAHPSNRIPVAERLAAGIRQGTAGASGFRRPIMSKLTAQETISLAAQLDADEARIHAAVGSADTPMTPLAQREARDEGDLADEEITQRQDDAMLDHYRMQLADIAAAQARMQHGQYGICIDCQQPIPFSRLQAYPTAKRCTVCQRRHEQLYA